MYMAAIEMLQSGKRQVDGTQIRRQTDGTTRKMDRQTSGQLDGKRQIDGQRYVDRQTDKFTYRAFSDCEWVIVPRFLSQTGGQTGRQTDRQTARQMNGQKFGQTD